MLLGVEGRVESGRQVLLMLGSGLGALCPCPLRTWLSLQPVPHKAFYLQRAT